MKQGEQAVKRPWYVHCGNCGKRHRLSLAEYESMLVVEREYPGWPNVFEVAMICPRCYGLMLRFPQNEALISARRAVDVSDGWWEQWRAERHLARLVMRLLEEEEKRGFHG